MLIIYISIAVSGEHTIEAQVYKSYTYDYWGNAVSSPNSYVVDEVVNLNEEAENIEDVFVAEENKIFIIDSEKDRILELDEDFNVKNEIRKFDNDGKSDNFNEPQGLYITENEEIIVGDTGNARVLLMDFEGKLLEEIDDPSKAKNSESKLYFPENFNFRPVKVAEGLLGRIYVISEGAYEGMLEFSRDGYFEGFYGAPDVQVNPVDYFWSQIATREQQQRMSLTLPIVFSNLDVDKNGFVYTTVSEGMVDEEQYIKKLNPAGEDVLVRQGFFPPSGDIDYPEEDSGANQEGPSSFVDITVRDNGLYSVLDQKRGRIFTYDKYGNLLYVFGGRGHADGVFISPRIIENIEEKLLVVDNNNNEITIFKPTNYAKNIHAALRDYEEGFYKSAAENWFNVLRNNTNYDLAYTGIGRNYFRLNEFEEALNYFRQGHNREEYSKVLTFYRKEVLLENAGTVFFVFTLVLLSIIIIYKFSLINMIIMFFGKLRKKSNMVYSDRLFIKNKFSKSVRYVLINCLDGFMSAKNIIFHPFGGFWELKQDKKNNYPGAFLILGFVIFSYVFSWYNTGFLFNHLDFRELNLLREILSIIFPFLLWCIINWSFTTLMDGKGTIKKIFIYSTYSLFPLAVINVPLAIISNFITFQEASFYYFIISLSIIWAMVLLFFGTLVIHEYTLGKTILAIICIIIGIGAVLFIGLIIFMVVGQFTGFLRDVYNELLFRI